MNRLLSVAAGRRHHLLASLGVAFALTAGANLLVSPTTAQSTAPTGTPNLLAQAGYYRMRVGAVTITALSDGTLPLTYEFLTHTTAAEVDQLLARAKVPYPIETSVNAYLLDTGSRLVLVDTGAGELMVPTLGRLLTSLQAAGYQPAQVTDVLITHIHSDHTGGLTVGDQRLFPNATVHVSQAESNYWLSDANLAKAPTDGKVLALDRRFFLEARAKMGPYVAAGKVHAFAANTEVVPGIRGLVEPGHTPGHTSYVLESQGQKVIFGGDVLHAAAVQLTNPAVTFIGDVDAKEAVAVRRQVLNGAARQGYWLALPHVSFPGIGHIRATGKRYEWLPINYSTTAAGQ